MFKLSKSKSINFAKIYNEVETIIGRIPVVKKRRRLRLFYKILKYFNYSIILLFLIILILFISQFLTIKKIYDDALAGKRNLEEAANLAKDQSFQQALILAKTSNINFNDAIFESENFKQSIFLRYFPILKNQFNNIESLLITGEFLSRVVIEATTLGQSLEELLEPGKKLNFSKFTQEEKNKILARLYQSGPELAGMKANIDLALINLEQVKPNLLLWPINNKISLLKVYLEQGKTILEQGISLSEILPPLAGYPKKVKYLIILENSDELRPTGGFIGTYGILEIESGEILKFETHDIYHLDMPVKDKLSVIPPEPIKKYLGVSKWMIRDANWSPDWPTSAKKIEWFYNQENQLAGIKDIEKFDGIIAITPKLIIDLLAITGPIVVEEVEYNKDNFQNILEYKVEKGYVLLGIPSWERKEIIGDIAKEIKIKLFDLPATFWPEVIRTVDMNITRKNILVYLTNIELQNLVKKYGWSGEVKSSEGDYLMVVDANLAAFKTDAVMSKSINYNVEKGYNGLFTKLNISYSHHGSFDWRTTRYRTYTRIYLPLGSQLIKAQGISEGQVEIGSELGKTYFGAFISIEPGKIGNLYFEYKLPSYLEEKLAEEGDYKLLIQKQPGNNINELIVDLRLGDAVKSYSPTGFYVRKNREQIRWETDLNSDREFKVNF